MLGQELAREFEGNGYEVSSWDKEEIDITNRDEVSKKISDLKPEIIINAAAYNAVDKIEESDKELGEAVNGYAVGNLSEAAEAVGAILVHYSTDYVFEGREMDGYKENDEPRPQSIYAASKRLGEEELKNDKYYLIRTSWVFGSGGKDFIDTMIRLASERDELKVVNDQHGKPTYAPDLAKATQNLIESDSPFGIYHLTNEDDITWYEYAKKIVGKYGSIKGWGKKEFPHIIPVTSGEFPTPAKRPNWSILLNTKFSHLRPWSEALDEYLNLL